LALVPGYHFPALCTFVVEFGYGLAAIAAGSPSLLQSELGRGATGYSSHFGEDSRVINDFVSDKCNFGFGLTVTG